MSFKIGDRVTPVDAFDPNYNNYGDVISVTGNTIEVSYQKQPGAAGFNLNYIYNASALKLANRPAIGIGDDVKIITNSYPLLNGKKGKIKSYTYSNNNFVDVEVIGEPILYSFHVNELSLLDFDDLFEDTLELDFFKPACRHKKSKTPMQLVEKHLDWWYYCIECGAALEEFQKKTPQKT